MPRLRTTQVRDKSWEQLHLIPVRSYPLWPDGRVWSDEPDDPDDPHYDVPCQRRTPPSRQELPIQRPLQELNNPGVSQRRS